MKRGFLLGLLLPVCPALAVVPLVTDDADPVELGHVQINSGWQFSRADTVDLNSLDLIPVMGITSRSEFGMIFGYQWRDGTAGADGITDLTLETKWRLWGKAGDNFKLSTRFDMKLPTASVRLGLGTGDPDADAFLIATCSRGKTSFDWNVGYIKMDASRAVFDADQWFLGQAFRQQWNDRWALIGETYAIIPQGAAGAPLNFDFDGGIQYSVSENFLFSLLVGSAIGRNSPDLTTNFGFTWTF
ncbi:MAG TPA: transporter [Verrucomicrobiae bacterium]|nr:transporter [Verrucomicrobiae bacterium]